MKLINEKPDTAVIYNDNNCPIGHFLFEDYRRDKSGVNLRWADSDHERHCIHFVGATRQSIADNWQGLVEKHILGISTI